MKQLEWRLKFNSPLSRRWVIRAPGLEVAALLSLYNFKEYQRSLDVCQIRPDLSVLKGTENSFDHPKEAVECTEFELPDDALEEPHEKKEINVYYDLGMETIFEEDEDDEGIVYLEETQNESQSIFLEWIHSFGNLNSSTDDSNDIFPNFSDRLSFQKSLEDTIDSISQENFEIRFDDYYDSFDDEPSESLKADRPTVYDKDVEDVACDVQEVIEENKSIDCGIENMNSEFDIDSLEPEIDDDSDIMETTLSLEETDIFFNDFDDVGSFGDTILNNTQGYLEGIYITKEGDNLQDMSHKRLTFTINDASTAQTSDALKPEKKLRGSEVHVVSNKFKFDEGIGEKTAPMSPPKTTNDTLIDTRHTKALESTPKSNATQRKTYATTSKLRQPRFEEPKKKYTTVTPAEKLKCTKKEAQKICSMKKWNY